jgi:ABC-type transport system involved in multi-copper enzyme maturation permease subunit
MAIAITITNIFATLIMCQVTDTSFSLTAGLPTLGLAFIQACVYMMFALLLATFFRRSGVAIIVYFIYGLLFEFLFMWIFSKIIPGMQHFLPLQVADSLIPITGVKGLLGENPGLEIMIPAAIAFAGLYVFLTVRKYKYDDL